MLTKRGRLTPLRIGFWRRHEILLDPAVSPSQLYRPDVLLCAVEPQVATMLELQKLSKFSNLVYSPSRNRQCHTFTVLEKRDTRSLTLKRVFLRRVLHISWVLFAAPCSLCLSVSGGTQETERQLAVCLRS